jgi:hypothetical protein
MTDFSARDAVPPNPDDDSPEPGPAAVLHILLLPSDRLGVAADGTQDNAG